MNTKQQYNLAYHLVRKHSATHSETRKQAAMLECFHSGVSRSLFDRAVTSYNDYSKQDTMGYVYREKIADKYRLAVWQFAYHPNDYTCMGLPLSVLAGRYVPIEFEK